LDEAFTALEESFHDLSDAQAAEFAIEGRNNIAWIVMHCLQNLDHYANHAPTDDQPQPRNAIAHHDRYDLWQAPPDRRPKPGDPFPTVADMLDKLNAVGDAAMAILEDRGGANVTRSTDWHHSGRSVVADAYMRTIYHTMAHVRQVWALRGVMGRVDADRQWPRQHWA
jgi:hypothetical protein